MFYRFEQCRYNYVNKIIKNFNNEIIIYRTDNMRVNQLWNEAFAMQRMVIMIKNIMRKNMERIRYGFWQGRTQGGFGG